MEETEDHSQAALKISRSSRLCPLPHCAGLPQDMPSANIPSECEDCVQECDIETCDLGAQDPQCTDRCLVVPCEDSCFDICSTYCASWSPCDAPCSGFETLAPEITPLDASLAASIASHRLPHTQERDGIQHLDWSNVSLSDELDTFICACETQSFPDPFHSDTCDPKLLTVDKSLSPSRYQSYGPCSPSIDVSRSRTPAPTSFSPGNGSIGSSPELTSSTASESQSAVIDMPGCSSRVDVGFSESTESEDFLCLWAECGKPFPSYQDLICHVNSTHLHLPINYENLSLQQYLLQQSNFSVQQTHGATSAVAPNLSCMWRDCNTYPTPSHVPGPSTGDVTGAALDLLAYHLLQDHLGVTSPQIKPEKHSQHNSLLPTKNARSGHDNDISSSVHVSPETSTSKTQLVSQNLDRPVLNNVSQGPVQLHFCKWQHCAVSTTPFASSTDLTAHITEVHVGGGKNRYHCMWGHCKRQGTAGFSSKQKILRHIQSHTGHRPFQCKLCDQAFSEVATLQQHMRRHTKERPYVCDSPGCNKSFAIAGALTIHKRTHSGKKPFKCQYCDHSFSESSNLSKHIRTHTGDRPYVCQYFGCGKRFARPDQASRHMNVHNKKGIQERTKIAIVEDSADIHSMEI